MSAELIIRNGRVIDPASGIDGVMDVFLGGGKILGIGKYFPESSAETEPGEFHAGCEEIDASGCVVTPGLFDSHMHVFYRCGFGCVPGDVAMFPGGVTAGLDAGSAGVLNYPLMHDVVHSSLSTIKTMLFVSATGIVMTHYSNEDVDPRHYDLQAMKDCIARYPGEIVGLKMRVSKRVIGDWGTKPLEAAVKIGEELGLPLMIHPSDPFAEQEVIFDILRPGDIYAHTYTPEGLNMIGENGKVKQAFHRAREKGIKFDLSHGRGQFNIDVFSRAFKEGFAPDSISTDMTPLSMNKAPTYSLVNVMSKLMALGMTLEQVIKAVTVSPAGMYGVEKEIGSLRVGGRADVAVLKIKNDREYIFTDSRGGSVRGSELIVPQMTVKDGMIVYRNAEFC